MTITNTDREVVYIGDGSTTVWAYTFLIPDANSANLAVRTNATGAEVVISSGDYTVAGLGDSNGGTFTYPKTGPALSSDFSVVIYRNVPNTQETSVTNQTRYDASVVEEVWDSLTMQLQDRAAELSRVLQVAVGEAKPNPLYPVEGTTLLWEGPNLVQGPTAAEISGAQSAAISATASADTATTKASEASNSADEAAASAVLAASYNVAYLTRSAFVTASSGITLPDGQAILAGGLWYVKNSGSTNISDIPDFDAVAPVEPGHLGAVSGGTVCTAELQEWLNYPARLFAQPTKTYYHDAGLTPPADLLLTGKLNLRLTETIAGAASAITFLANSWVEALELYVETGKTIRRPININGAGGIFGSITLGSADQQANRDNSLDAGIYVSAQAIIGDVFTDKFDNGLLVYNSTDTKVGDIKCTNYVQGFKAREITGLVTGKVTCHTASVNATPDPGHNGVLLEQVWNYNSGPYMISDSGEHGFRIGGSTGGIGCRNITIPTVTTKNTGQCGMKVNDNSKNTRDINVGALFVVDAAQAGAAGTNEDGLRIEKCKGVTVGTVRISSRETTHSCYDGVFISGSEDIFLPSVWVQTPSRHAVHITDVVTDIVDETLATGNIHIGRLTAMSGAADVLRIAYTVQDINHITVGGGYVRDFSSGSVLNLATNDGAGTSGITNPLEITLSYHNVSAAVTTASTSTRIYTTLTSRA